MESLVMSCRVSGVSFPTIAVRSNFGKRLEEKRIYHDQE